MKWRALGKDVSIPPISSDLQIVDASDSALETNVSVNSIASQTTLSSVTSHPPPPLLLISPNLGVLLEHEELTRCSLDSVRTSAIIDDDTTPHPPPSGLSPPPRGPRRIRTRRPASLQMQNTPQASPELSTEPPTVLTRLTTPSPSLTPPRSSLSQNHQDSSELPILDTPNDVLTSVAGDMKTGDEQSIPVNDPDEQEHRNPVEPLVDVSTSPTSDMPVRPAVRPLLTHVPSHSQDSSYYPSSVSSHDPPSTTHEPRISISSTIYPSSSYANSITYYPLDEEPRPNDILTTEHISDGMPASQESFMEMDDTGPSNKPSLTSVKSAEASLGHSQLTPIAPPRSDSLLDYSIIARSSQTGKFAQPQSSRSTFKRPASGQRSPSKQSNPSSPITSPKISNFIPQGLIGSRNAPGRDEQDTTLPPTTNTLTTQERIELVRKTRKLTQMFGQTPAASVTHSAPDSPTSLSCFPPFLSSRRVHSRGTLSLADDLTIVIPGQSTEDSTAPPFLTQDKRRHSSPLSPMTFKARDFDEGQLSPGIPEHVALDMNEDLLGNTKVFPTAAASDQDQLRTIPRLSSAERLEASRLARTTSNISLAESLTDEQRVEEERRRKRVKLAKLHRFLGSRVPADLVLGIEAGAPLPAVAVPAEELAVASDSEAGGVSKAAWIPRRRRSSSAAAFPPQWSKDTDRVKEELGTREKAINVRRALKMEKMFGEQPPQNLFHTRHTVHNGSSPRKIDNSQGTLKQVPPAIQSPTRTGRNLNRSAYLKAKPKKAGSRPGTAESTAGLLPNRDQAVDNDYGDTSMLRAINGQDFAQGMSAVYMHYRHSLNSLTDIVNRDDKQTLAELHDAIAGSDPDDVEDVLPRSKSTTRAERRRSLPLRHSISISSISSDCTITLKSEPSAFQIRRRRAAKLTHFFGVNYRELFKEVLESIEMGVREDAGRGTMKPDEVQDLLVKLRGLKKRRDEIN